MLRNADLGRTSAISADWALCDAIARSHGRTFYLASRFLPPERRRGVLATYAFCRIADDIVDAAPERGAEASAAALDGWAAEIETPVHPVAVAFAEARARFGIPRQPVHDLLTGIRMDLTTTSYATWPELRTYCHLVAGTVGLMVAPVLGCRATRAIEHAATLGIAMQITNILRDVAEDAARGRLYLPLDEIAAFGCDPEAILAGRPGKQFPALMAFQIRRARALYAAASPGIRALSPSGQITTLAASRLYAGILSEIESLEYDVFRTRAHVAGRQKLRALPGVAAAFMRLSLTPATEAGASFAARQSFPETVPVAGRTESLQMAGRAQFSAPVESPPYG